MPNKPGNDDRNTATGAGADVGGSQAQSGSSPQRRGSSQQIETQADAFLEVRQSAWNAHAPRLAL